MIIIAIIALILAVPLGAMGNGIGFWPRPKPAFVACILVAVVCLVIRFAPW
jgi:hypothetical protein